MNRESAIPARRQDRLIEFFEEGPELSKMGSGGMNDDRHLRLASQIVRAAAHAG